MRPSFSPFWGGDFYPRPPRGGRRCFSSTRVTQKYFYPRPPRGGRPAQPRATAARGAISIHALREEGDLRWICSHR